jgi:outer membrane protein TolC
VRQAELESRLAGRFLRFPELTAGWQHVQEPEFDSSGLIVAGSWPLPLFDRQQGDRIAAESRLTVAKARLDIETHRVASRIAGAHAAYARLRDAAIGAMDSVAAADRITEAAAARFEAGESDATDLLETMRSVLSARMAAIDLYEEALATHRKLELLTTRSSSSVDGGER